MEPESESRNLERLAVAAGKLAERGFRQMRAKFWIFQKGGKLYDLSAADLEQIERIERDGLFVCGRMSFASTGKVKV